MPLGIPVPRLCLLILLTAILQIAPARGEEKISAGEASTGGEYRITVDGEVDERLAPVAGKLTELYFQCYPALVRRFENPDRPAPRHIKVRFKSGIKVPAYCSGDAITVSVEWLTKHPEDLGMLTHELTHAVQAYPNANPGWFTEGLADYARKRYGPKEQPNWALPERLTSKNSYRESYRVAGRFFEWLDGKYPEALDKLHRRMQSGEFVVEDFDRVTGASLDSLWERCVQDLQTPQKTP